MYLWEGWEKVDSRLIPKNLYIVCKADTVSHSEVLLIIFWHGSFSVFWISSLVLWCYFNVHDQPDFAWFWKVSSDCLTCVHTCISYKFLHPRGCHFILFLKVIWDFYTLKSGLEIQNISLFRVVLFTLQLVVGYSGTEGMNGSLAFCCFVLWLP